MELKYFIKNTLISIKEGVHGANEQLAIAEGKKLGEDFGASYVLQHTKDNAIDFDVAVTINNEEKNSLEGGGGINISVMSLKGEKGSEKNQTETNVTRIKFSIIPHRDIA